MKKSKVFIGPLEIANVAKSFANALRLQNIKVDYFTYSHSLHPFGYETEKLLLQFQNPPVKGINRILRFLFLIKILFNYNTFIFLSPESILRKNIDLPILRFFRKKVIFLFTGCAERDISFQLDNPNYICNRCKDENWKKMFLCNEISKKIKRVQNLEKYSNYILSQSDSASYLVKIKPIWFYVSSAKPEDKDYLEKFNTKKIVVAHLPSNPLVKQSHIIIPVLERISELEGFEVIIKNEIWNREKLISTLEKTHILVDAIGLGYGMLGVESMARGCIVMNSFDKWFSKNVPDAPIYRTSADTLYTDIINLAHNINLMKDYANRSINYFNKYHSPEAAGKYYKEKLNLN